jgi:predicted NBD/HSP70 family sugar kinase
LEAFASDLATLDRFRKKAKSDAANSRTRCASQDIGTVIELARQGEPIALESIQETAHYLGIGLAPIIYGLNPEAIVIGGKIAEIWPLVSPVVMKSLATRISSPYLNGVKILASTLHIRPSLLGAIALVLGQDFAAPDIL